MPDEEQSMHDPAVTETEVVFPGTAAMTYARSLPWERKWRLMLRELEPVEAAYECIDGPLRGEYRESYLNFCDACLEVRDALIAAGHEGGGEALDLRRQHPPALALVADLSNTDKHSGRRDDKRHARISELQSVPRDSTNCESARRLEIVVAHDDENGVEFARDGLDLAKSAIAEWRTILKTHGIREPDV